MTDKFVVSTNEIGRIIVTDVETGNVYHHDNLSNFLGLIRLLNELNDENKTLKAQLYCEGSVCTICKHQQLTPDKCMQGYYTAKCEKGHKECSKGDLKHCKDFKLEGLSE